MTQIGNFTKNSDGSYVGEIVTLWVQAKNVRIEALDSGQIENGFTHRVTVGRAEIGVARSNLSDSGQDCHRRPVGLLREDRSWFSAG